jgi:hypothetical protein
MGGFDWPECGLVATSHLTATAAAATATHLTSIPKTFKKTFNKLVFFSTHEVSGLQLGLQLAFDALNVLVSHFFSKFLQKKSRKLQG